MIVGVFVLMDDCFISFLGGDGVFRGVRLTGDMLEEIDLCGYHGVRTLPSRRSARTKRSPSLLDCLLQILFIELTKQSARMVNDGAPLSLSTLTSRGLRTFQLHHKMQRAKSFLLTTS